MLELIKKLASLEDVESSGHGNNSGITRSCDRYIYIFLGNHDTGAHNGTQVFTRISSE